MIDWRRGAYRYPGTLVIPWVTRGFTMVTPIISEVFLMASYIFENVLSGQFLVEDDLEGKYMPEWVVVAEYDETALFPNGGFEIAGDGTVELWIDGNWKDGYWELG